MSIRVEAFGTTKDGQQVKKYILENGKGMKAVVLNLGAGLAELWVPDQDGALRDVVWGYEKAEDYEVNGPDFGAIVGRNANRIGGAVITIAGKDYTLAKNNGENNLHSGPDMYFTRMWKGIVADDNKVEFSLHSPDGDQGYPGNADIRVSYTLTNADEIRIDYHMTCDEDTIANFTNHAYFNLAGQASGSAMHQKVWIDADQFTIADQYSIPTGELVPVKDTPMDFTTLKSIDQDIEADYEPLKFAGGYDHNWVLNHKEGELALCAKAVDEASGRVMEVCTDLPGIQFYTGNFLSPMEGKEKAVYDKRQGYCFETQYFPDAVNKPQFASPILKGGDIYSTTTIYKFKTEA